MPKYTYKCENCGTYLIRWEKMSEHNNTSVQCSQCGEKMHQLLDIGAVHFKGSGFHCNDYPSKRRW